ncbi:fused (3R)-hydroxyacyl-ACP dehydratase subunits HadA/HadB [Gordonia sp. HY285]|uniref:Fused (3R)-hydroxyacyl-ACP dehydratase subunits HadA/HadB n=1 Tax=Gordonia liuliyuniae TaxID=2911517 RepID=A0ABS9ITH3_9ACTN|nr:fused (3R)-hydroxyacyl-ACP dehydratase subunits HadA/HadB [Gordonia liuliyuniae]MCF8588870.1 fused (3R)-hydroxyacyl-ACP dehydratase subunits HadA/HadB [Gordonia liuliyuniae]MCF8609248.1 fused (3R)-hydroxyacyl-ACP dehydratase subunits HadA/HadB [Gordonia liuliyuniae]
MTSSGTDRTKAIEAEIGKVFTTQDYYEVGREKIREFARALHDDNPVHWDEAKSAAAGHDRLLAPLTIVVLDGTKAQAQLFEMIPGNPLKSGVLQVEQRFVFHKPVTAGDRLKSDVSLDSYKSAAGADLFTGKTVIRDLDKGVMQESWTTLAGPGESGDGLTDEFQSMVDDVMFSPAGSHVLPLVPAEAAEIPDDEPRAFGAIAFDSLTEGQEIPPRRQKFTRGDLVNYVGVAGDPNPIHYSDELAAAAKLDTVVAQGMLTLGTAAGYLSEFVGDPAAFRELSARFSSAVYVPPTDAAFVEYTAKIKTLYPETKRGLITFGATVNGKRVFGKCTALVQFS